jgi:hypothetical protein
MDNRKTGQDVKKITQNNMKTTGKVTGIVSNLVTV